MEPHWVPHLLQLVLLLSRLRWFQQDPPPIIIQMAPTLPKKTLHISECYHMLSLSMLMMLIMLDEPPGQHGNDLRLTI